MKKQTARIFGITRDHRVEALRIFACFSVLVLHFKPLTVVNGYPIYGRVLCTCFATDAVGVFLLIAGFYFFGSQSYGKRLVSGLKRILLPVFLYTVFVQVYPLLLGESVSVQSVLASTVSNFSSWQPVVDKTGHLWYLYTYFLVIAAAPLLQLVRRTFLNSGKGRAAFLAAVFALFLINDILDNRLLNSSILPVSTFIPGCLLVLAGDCVYRERARFKGRRLLRILSLSIFIALNVARAVYVQYRLFFDTSYGHMYGWYSSAGFLAALMLAVFALSFEPSLSGGAKTVNVIGSFTMGIYIFHVWMNAMCSRFGFISWLAGWLLDGTERFFQYIKFTLVYPAFVFIFCLIFVLLLKIPKILFYELRRDKI